MMTLEELQEAIRKLSPDERLADKCFELPKQDPQHPSLHLKKIGRFWSVRIGKRYRALTVEREGELLRFWLRSHDDYEKLLKQR